MVGTQGFFLILGLLSYMFTLFHNKSFKNEKGRKKSERWAEARTRQPSMG